jgi:acyl-homoserine-lactone acylase
MAKVYRDHFGIPHIDALDFIDAAKAIALCHAEDDFDTIQQWLLSARCQSGRVDDWDGPYIDFLCFFLGVRAAVTDNMHKVGSDYLKQVDAYCQGINLYAEEHPAEVLINGLFPITNTDLITVHHLIEVLGIQLDKPFSYLQKNKEVKLPKRDGSNVIALGSTRTTSKGPMIGMSPHQQLEGLFGFYEVHLRIQCEDLELFGYLLPCTFTVFMGTNFSSAWGFTANYPEMYTMYKAKVKGFFRKKVFIDGKWEPLKAKWYKNHTWLYGWIPFPILKKVYEARFGKIIFLGGNYLHIHIPLVGELIGTETNHLVNQSKSTAEIKAHCLNRRFPYLNLVAIDKLDNLLFMHNACEIEKENQQDHYSNFVELTSEQQLQKKYYGIDNVVVVENPTDDFLVSANQSPFKVTNESVDSSTKKGLLYFEDNSRSLRLKQLIAENEQHNMQDMVEFMSDTMLLFPVIRNIDFSAMFCLEINENSTPRIFKLWQILKEWNGNADLESEGAAVFSLLFHKYKEYYTYSKCPDVIQVATGDELITCLKWVERHYRNGMKLKDIQYLERGTKMLPVEGIPDSVNSIRPSFEKGCFIAEEGGAFKLIIDLKNREILACHPYGSSANNESPHYDDQMEMYVKNEYRRIGIFEDYLNNESLIK